MGEQEHDRRIRYAVIGAGNIAQVAVLPAFAHAGENSELVAIISGDRDKREELTARYHLSHTGAYDELEEVLRGAGVEAAYIALPNHMHREYTERCAALGVHVLVEKPMAMTTEDCEAMIAACRTAKVALMVAYRLHFEEANLRAIELVREGRIGEARSFSSVFSHDVREGDIRARGETGGGALYDLGIYCVNAARYLFGAEPLEVLGARVIGSHERFRDVDEMTVAILRFPGERIAQFTVNQGVAATSELRIIGTKGDLRLEPAYEYASGLKHFLTIDEKTTETEFAKRDQFAPELVYFSQCIIDDREPEPSGVEGLADVRVLEAIVESAESGTAVQLEPFERARRPDMSQNIRKPPLERAETVKAPSPSR
jgi:predicted dehydrogenase